MPRRVRDKGQWTVVGGQREATTSFFLVVGLWVFCRAHGESHRRFAVATLPSSRTVSSQRHAPERAIPLGGISRTVFLETGGDNPIGSLESSPGFENRQVFELSLVLEIEGIGRAGLRLDADHRVVEGGIHDGVVISLAKYDLDLLRLAFSPEMAQAFRVPVDFGKATVNEGLPQD